VVGIIAEAHVDAAIRVACSLEQDRGGVLVSVFDNRPLSNLRVAGGNWPGALRESIAAIRLAVRPLPVAALSILIIRTTDDVGLLLADDPVRRCREAHNRADHLAIVALRSH